MTRESGLGGPNASFSGGTAGSIDPESDPDASAGCLYETPSGPCGAIATNWTVAGVRVELCTDHLEAVQLENGVAPPPRSPLGRLQRRAVA